MPCQTTTNSVKNSRPQAIQHRVHNKAIVDYSNQEEEKQEFKATMSPSRLLRRALLKEVEEDWQRLN